MALIQINQFKGINGAVDPTILGEEGTNAYNTDLRDGTIKATRKPLKKYTTPIRKLVRIAPYYKSSGTSYIIATDTDGVMYRKLNDTWNSIGTKNNGVYLNYVHHNIDGEDIIIMTNRFDNVFMYNGATLKDLRMLGKDSDYGNPENRAPKGSFLAVHHERLWIADNNYVYCSSVTANGGIDIEDFTTPTDPPAEVNQHGAQIFMYSSDGTKIKGMAVIYDDILIFKEKKIFKLSGTSPADLQKVELFTASGAIAGNSIVATPHGCFFMHEDGIYLYDGASVNKISHKIDKLWKNVKADAILNDNAEACYYNGKYILAVKTADSLYLNLIIEYDILTGNFTTRYSYDARNFINMNGELLFASNDGCIYSYDKGEADTFIWQSGDITIAEGGIEVEGVKLHTSGTGKLKVSVITEKKTKEKIVDIVKDGVKYISINNTGRSASVKIEQISGDITIRKMYVECDVDED